MWELLPSLLPLLLFGCGLFWLSFRERDRRLRGWQDAAVACGLQILDPSAWSQRLTARKGPVEVKIEVCGSKGQSTRIIVSIPGHPEEPEQPFQTARKEPVGRRV